MSSKPNVPCVLSPDTEPMGQVPVGGPYRGTDNYVLPGSPPGTGNTATDAVHPMLGLGDPPVQYIEPTPPPPDGFNIPAHIEQVELTAPGRGVEWPDWVAKWSQS